MGKEVLDQRSRSPLWHLLWNANVGPKKKPSPTRPIYRSSKHLDSKGTGVYKLSAEQLLHQELRIRVLSSGTLCIGHWKVMTDAYYKDSTRMARIGIVAFDTRATYHSVHGQNSTILGDVGDISKTFTS
ncbi:hypothetical protein DITRI_Ditri16bG0063000 [Diplodiscus trichospermus]